jgi:hypothetical protein
MKKLILTTVVTGFGLVSNAQIKVWSGGNTVLGSTSSSSIGAKLQIAGNSVFTSTVGTTNSAAEIRGRNDYSSATTPDFTWYSNDQLGLFHPASNVMGFAVNGNEAMRLNSRPSNTL